ncbi:DUF3465 domain-containing protein [Methylomonas sp. SURF-2]|uniref:DUF3465 domain-containing protein n=1 Tax=Methylomonas subterranea TaxID=2952225 RepID=A0ABT1TBI0_9GAMM|nr:DUF3465 domain-containing protein [Methylomonas sp. SURF-2]MCQ8102820.1 DUF3465 domain-containing protein [Methylomonas sp. SURF-2]
MLLLIGGQSTVWADAPNSGNDALLAEAFRSHRSDLQMQGQGTVIKLLPDDNQGSRHQRFILRLHSGQTLLIAHNIDLAAKIEGLRVGDTVSFYGEYEWSDKGGTVHWTHHDPARRHLGGWLRHDGRTYQ